ncbi:accessory Sec system translocase SecA2 [Oceanobacillus massiliensis]|uniref:accessory Sec system translocase SecA2 n=1 Tax=Oceanobacillus massiliensis TaxID=1465765 RepID=UPI003018D6FD
MKLFKDAPMKRNLRELKTYNKSAEKINKLEKQFERLSDDELKQKTFEFKQRLNNGETIHELAVEAFATVREASKRIIGLRHYDVQLIGGLVLLDGNVAEMATGEGKTLVASLTTYLVALQGKGIHVITVNEYLAIRDKELIGQIHEYLGLTVGLNIPGMDKTEKKNAYNCDITYGVGSEFGFDYLRDNSVQAISHKVQRPYHFAIIDEIDSVLIDEAKTPLIIAGKEAPSDRLYKVCASVMQMLNQEEDYTFDSELKVVSFTEAGLSKCERIFALDNLFDLEHSSLFHSLLQALRAKVLYQKDVEYIVDQGEVKLIDINTGRIMEGRSLSGGLHQAIESKEGLKNTDENKTHASITIQNYYRMYPLISGMTGTAKAEETELREIYGMNVVQVPTNKPKKRVDFQDKVFMTKEDKFAHLINEIQRRHKEGQPILIGTTSILQSMEVADSLKEKKLPYQLLNAKSADEEAKLIALAGQRNQITISTNMAGRGTDIMLGEGAAELGGLHVIGTERNESRRIDDQLRGRSARQGDPGSTEFIISIEDYLFTRYAAEELDRSLPKFKTNKDGLITSSNIHKYVETAQRISEGVQYQFRNYNLNLENVINEQRSVIYNLRDSILGTSNVISFLIKQVEELPNEIISSFCDKESLPEEWDLHVLEEKLNRMLINPLLFKQQEFQSINDVRSFADPYINSHFDLLHSYEEDEDMQNIFRGIAIHVVDKYWKEHLETMNQLKEGIGIRQYQQEDPIQLFQKEGYLLFSTTYEEIRYALSKEISQLIEQMMSKEKENI